MTSKPIIFYTISTYSHYDDAGDRPRFETRELANQYILAELKPKDWGVSVQLSNVTVNKKETVQVERERRIYFKSDPMRVKKIVKEMVEEDRWTSVYDFQGYVNSEYEWRKRVTNSWGNEPKLRGYYVCKAGEVTSEVTDQTVRFTAPVLVQFIQANLVVTPEIKVDGQPYQARKEEVKTEVMSDWLPVYVHGGHNEYNRAEYAIDPGYSRNFMCGTKPYVTAIEYYVNENTFEIITAL